MKPLVLACFFGSACPVWAETAAIRSGEHDSYSRLAISIPAGANWEIFATEDGYLAQFGAPVDEIDTTDVFERIPRTRLSDVVSDGPALDLLLGCDCHLDAFLFRPNLLVIDIIDGPAPVDSPLEQMAEAEVEQAEPTVLDIAQPPETIAELRNQANQTAQSTAPTEITLPLFTQSPLWSDTINALPPSFSPQTARDPNLVEAERAILESFARAATQGVFDFPARPLPPPLEEGQDPVQSPIQPMTDPMDGVPIPLNSVDPEGPGFLLRTGIDRDAMADTSDDQMTSCPGGINHRLNTWGEAGEYGTVIPQLRLAATNEVGQPQPEPMYELARAYIYYGFGLEARRVLEALGEPSDQSRYLTALAHLVDGDPLPVRELLPYRACGETMEAWIALASGRLDTSDQRIISSILIATRALPDPLRGHIGVRLAQIFAEAGELHNAQEILSGSLAAVTGEGRHAELAAADLAGRTRGLAAEVAHLDSFIETNPRAEPEDMVRLLDLARESETPIDEGVLEIAETMRFEADGGALAADLIEAEVLFLLDMGQYEPAFELLAGDLGPMTEERFAALYSAAVVMLAQGAGDDDFLTFAFSNEADGVNHMAEHALAERLLKMGFAAQAFVLIEEPITGALRDERLALQARSAVAMADIQTADALAESMETQDDPPLTTAQSVAPILAPDLAEAREASPLDGAWRAGAWDVLEQSDDPLLSSASRALLTPTEPPGEETPLADSRALLDQAQEARDLAEGLLTRFSIDDPIEDDTN